jgi:hypothetical protein
MLDNFITGELTIDMVFEGDIPYYIETSQEQLMALFSGEYDPPGFSELNIPTPALDA